MGVNCPRFLDCVTQPLWTNAKEASSHTLAQHFPWTQKSWEELEPRGLDRSDVVF